MDSREVAYSGAVCLRNLMRKDGSYTYRYDSGSGALLDGYNVLRHAGAVLSMLDVYREVDDISLLDSGKRATHFLLDSYLRFFRSYNNACICEDNRIKLGGNALATLALLSLHELTREPFLLAVAGQLTHFVISQRSEKGGFVHKRYFESGKISDFTSMYYTGEALLSLLHLYRLTKSKELLDIVLALEDKLAEGDYGVAEQSHWMLYTLELLSTFVQAPAYYRHAARIANHILDNPDYLTWERSTPIACRSEGLLAFLRMRRPEGSEDGLLQARCREQVQHNLKLQLGFRLPDGSFVRGGKDRRKDEVRIDYIQHNISSFMAAARLGLEA